MKIQKPQPLMMGGKAYYTLSNTDPVEIEVVIPQVTEEELDYALVGLAEELGVSHLNDVPKEQLESIFGTCDIQTIRSGIYAQMTDANYSMLNNQRAELSAAKLAERLGQEVPDSFVNEIRQQLEADFMNQIRREGTSIEDMLVMMNATPDTLSASFEERARRIAEQDAALGAFARDRKLTIHEPDYPRLLQMTYSQVEALLEQARAVGQQGRIYESALRNRALELVVAESICTYREETDEEAASRLKRLQHQWPQHNMQLNSDRQGRGINPNLKLV